MAEKLCDLRTNKSSGGSSFEPTYLGGQYATSVPNKVNLTLGSGEHHLLIVASSSGTNLQQGQNVEASFNGVSVTLTEIFFDDHNAADLYTGYAVINGSGTLNVGISGSNSGRTTMFQVIEI